MWVYGPPAGGRFSGTGEGGRVGRQRFARSQLLAGGAAVKEILFRFSESCERLDSWWHLCTQRGERRFDERSTSLVREATRQQPRPAAQEAQAQELAAAIAQAAQEDLLRIARDAVLRVAAKAYQQRLAKKTATRAPA